MGSAKHPVLFLGYKIRLNLCLSRTMGYISLFFNADVNRVNRIAKVIRSLQNGNMNGVQSRLVKFRLIEIGRIGQLKGMTWFGINLIRIICCVNCCSVLYSDREREREKNGGNDKSNLCASELSSQKSSGSTETAMKRTLLR